MRLPYVWVVQFNFQSDLISSGVTFMHWLLTTHRSIQKTTLTNYTHADEWKKKKPTTTTTFQCQTADTYQSQSNSHFPNRISVLNKHDSCSDQMLCSQRTEIMLKCIKKAILRTQSVSNGLRTWTVNRTSVCYSHRIHNAIHFNLYMLIYRRELTSVLFCVCGVKTQKSVWEILDKGNGIKVFKSDWHRP